MKAAGKNFEVVFVSRDRSPEDLVAYYNDHHGTIFPFLTNNDD